MKSIIQKRLRSKGAVIAVFLVTLLVLLLPHSLIVNASPIGGTGGTGTPSTGGTKNTGGSSSSSCDTTTDGTCAPCVADPNKAGCIQCGQPNCSDNAVQCNQTSCDFIGKYVNPAINLFSASFALIAIISLILGSINYITSEGDPQKTSRAKARILNTMIALFAYMILYGFLQFIIPGGLFRTGG